MDRSFFLRSLPYLRSLPPSIWQKIQEEPSSSCSTALPVNDLDAVILDDAAISIEPVYKSGNRKRDRHDSGGRGRPSFFSCKPINSEIIAKPHDVNENQSRKAVDVGEINNDPAMCSFEVAIARKHVLYGLGHTKDMLTTPNKKHNAEVDEEPATESYDLDSKILLFRFGNYFVFEANASSTVKVDFVDKETKSNGDATTENDVEHQSKRQKTEAGKADSSNDEKRPASLYVEFPSCVFRAFALNANNTDVDARLLNAKSKILQHCDIESSTKTWDTLPIPEDRAESWSTCLDLEQTKDKVSPTKTDSASTHIEQGQQQSTEIKPSHDNDMDDEAEENVDNSETQPTDSIAKKSSDQSSQKSNNLLQKSSKADSMCSEQNSDGQDCLFLDEISSKRRDFDNSWSNIHKAMSSNGKSTPLTTCAYLLASSYCAPKQLASYNEQCDAEIEHSTGEIQDLIETAMPTRGRAHGSIAPNPSCGPGVNVEESIHDLLLARKKAIAAKYALFIVPKR